MQRRPQTFGDSAYGAKVGGEGLGVGFRDGGGEGGCASCFRFFEQMGCARDAEIYDPFVFTHCCSEDVP
eukprot:12817445-Prorocentrum_lima.AAC.1